MYSFWGSLKIEEVKSSSSESKANWDRASITRCWSSLRCSFNILLEEWTTKGVGWVVIPSERKERSWKGFWILEGAFAAIQFLMWGSCWEEDGEKFDYHLTLNSCAKCVGKEGSIRWVWTKSQQKIHGIWKREVKKRVWEQWARIKPLACSLK